MDPYGSLSVAQVCSDPLAMNVVVAEEVVEDDGGDVAQLLLSGVCIHHRLGAVWVVMLPTRALAAS